METHQRNIGEKQFGRVYEYDDAYVLALDLRDTAGEITVDTVGTTAIVVAEGADGGNAESEFDLPGEAEETNVTNGVLTIEVPK
ncbi:MAG: Hsp20/alpha crystallin family protein [Halolamina sp.]